MPYADFQAPSMKEEKKHFIQPSLMKSENRIIGRGLNC